MTYYVAVDLESCFRIMISYTVSVMTKFNPVGSCVPS